MPDQHAIGEHRDLLIDEVIFGLRERLQAADELADLAHGHPIAAVDLLDTLDGLGRHAAALRALGLGTR